MPTHPRPSPPQKKKLQLPLPKETRRPPEDAVAPWCCAVPASPACQSPPGRHSFEHCVSSLAHASRLLLPLSPGDDILKALHLMSGERSLKLACPGRLTHSEGLFVCENQGPSHVYVRCCGGLMKMELRIGIPPGRMLPHLFFVISRQKSAIPSDLKWLAHTGSCGLKDALQLFRRPVLLMMTKPSM
ncbi:hypothetical protein EJB05_35273, partial [Eragrostis curvula]